MKTWTLSGWVLGVVLASGAVGPGFAQDAIKPSRATVSSNTTAVAAPPPAVPALTKEGGAKSSSATVYASPWVDEVERLTKAGVDEGVVLAYVINSAGTFNLTADQIVRLKNLGVSPQVMNAMMQHDQELISGARPLTAASPPSLPTALRGVLSAHPQPAVATATPSAAAAAPVRGPVQIVANDDYNAEPDWIYVEPDDVPEQPASLGAGKGALPCQTQRPDHRPEAPVLYCPLLVIGLEGCAN